MWQLNYSVVVAEDTVRSLNAEMHRFSFETTLRRAARVRSTDAILEALPQSPGHTGLRT